MLTQKISYQNNIDDYEEEKPKAKLEITPTSESSKDFTYKEKIEKKVREQAKRLLELQTYKNLCEQRILQLIPNHSLPVTTQHLQENSPKIDLNEITNLKQTVEIKNKTINELEYQLNEIKSKYERINEMYDSNTLHFPTPDKIPSNYEKLKDLYIRLLFNHNENLKEKNELIEALKNETLSGEEQKNYIELLKQTLENKIGKMSSNIVNHNQKYYENDDITSTDILIDFVNLKNESENYRKELIISQVLINELKEEIERLKSCKSEVLSSQQKIFENYEKATVEIETSKQKVKEIEKENIIFTEELYKAKAEYNNLLEDYNSINKKFKKCEDENMNLTKKNAELSIKMNDYTYIQAKLNEYKINLEKITDEFEKMSKEKIKLEAENNQLTEDLSKKIEEIKKTKDFLCNKDEVFELEKKNYVTENKKLEKQLRILENQIKESTDNLKEKEADLVKMEEELKASEVKFSNSKNTINELSNEILVLKKNLTTTNDINERNINEQRNLVKELKIKIDNITKDKENLSYDSYELRNEINKLTLENNQLKSDLKITTIDLDKQTKLINEELLKQIKQIEIDRNTIKGEKENLAREIKILNDKYDREITQKDNEIECANLEINKFKEQLKTLKEKTVELKQNFETNDDKVISLQTSIEIKEEEIKKLLNKEKELNKIIDNLTITSKKYEYLVKEKEDLSVELVNKKYQIEDLQSTKEMLENKMIELETLSFKHEETKKKVLYESEIIKENYTELQKKYEKLSYDLENILNKNEDLEKQNSMNLIENQEISIKLSAVEVENEKIKIIIDELKQENESLKMNHENEMEKLNSLHNLLQEIKITLHSSFSISKVFIHKFISIINEDLSHSYSKGFCEILHKFSLLNNFLPSETNPLEIIKNLEDFIRYLGTELEIIYNKFQETKDYLSEENYKTQSLSQELDKWQLGEEKRKSNEKKLKQLNRQISEDNQKLVNQLETSNDKCEKYIKEIKIYKSEQKKNLDELTKIRSELNELNKIMSLLQEEKKEKQITTDNLELELSSLEQRSIFIIKEKKYLETLIFKLSKCFPARELCKVINDIVNLNEAIFQLERDKNKIDQRLKFFLNSDSEVNIASNNELNKTIQLETENLKELSRNLERRINEKRDIQKNLEVELKNIELNERKKYDQITQNEIKIRHLEYQLSDNCDDSKRKNLGKTFLSRDTRDNILISNNYNLENSNENPNNLINLTQKQQFKYNPNIYLPNSEYSVLSGVRNDLTNYDSIIDTKNQTNFLSQNDTYFINNNNSTKFTTNYSKKY